MIIEENKIDSSNLGFITQEDIKMEDENNFKNEIIQSNSIF